MTALAKRTGRHNWRCTGLACVLLFLCRTSAVRAADNLVITTQTVASQYCLEERGAISLRVSLRIMYNNAGAAPVLLPFFTRVAGYVLSSDGANPSSRQERSVMFQNPPTFDSSKLLDASKPDPKLFQTIAPGASAERVLEVPIIVRSPQSHASALLGKVYSLRAKIENWPDSRDNAVSFRRLWEPYGVLWADPDVTAPVELRIEGNPVASRCGGRID